jgi:type IV secretory pathway VirB6-like protein
MLSGNSSQFLTLGLALASGLAIILISRYGITTALSGRGFNFADFFNEVILLVATSLCLLRGYSTPLAVFGDRTFPDLIIDGPAQLAAQISFDSNQQLDTLFKTALSPDNKPINPLDLSAIAAYWVMRLFIEGTRGIMFAVTAFGFVAQAILVLLGPVFLPFLLFKPLSFMFWGWFKSLLQYSFYPLVCACFSSVLTSFFINLYKSQLNDTMTVVQALTMIPFFFIIILGMLSVPLVVSALFSGSTANISISKFF